MGNVQAVMGGKHRGYISVGMEATVAQALALMAEKGIGAVLVMKGDTLEGIFSERDFARAAARQGARALGAPVRELMTRPVHYVPPDASTDACMALMTEKHFRHLPVVVDGQVTGMVTMGDIVKEVIADKIHEIRGLENYITSREHQL